MNYHHPLPLNAKPIAELYGSLVAVLPPQTVDGAQYLLIENWFDETPLASILDPEGKITTEDDDQWYLRLEYTPELGRNIAHLVDLLAEIQRRAPTLVQLPLVNFDEAS